MFVGEDESVPGARGSNGTLVYNKLLSETVERSSGALTRVDSKTLDGVCARVIAVDHLCKYVYIGTTEFGASHGQIEGFAIGATGTLTVVPGSPFLVNGTPTGLVMHPNGKFIYAATDSGVLVIDRDPASGALLQSDDFNTPKRRLALNPARTFLVAANSTATKFLNSLSTPTPEPLRPQ